jgi:ABC-2 type transport system ATP-binding protein/manganese/iron transport system ATP-binding protein
MDSPTLVVGQGSVFGYKNSSLLKQKEIPILSCEQDIEYRQGIHLLVAPNGYGKTTLMRSMAGLLPCLKGNVTINKKILYFSDELSFDPLMTARQLLKCFFKGEALTFALQFSEAILLDLKKRIRTLSKGNRQKVMIVVAETYANFEDEPLILMDEPFSGIDRMTRHLIVEQWNKIKNRTTRLVVLHEVDSLKEVDSWTSIQDGKLTRGQEKPDFLK